MSSIETNIYIESLTKVEANDHSFTILIDSEQEGKNYITDLIFYRELLCFLALRDILVRYRQAFFGVAWALIKPILTMLLFTLLFGRIANLSSGDVPYALFVLAGMLPWQLFSSSIIETSLSLVNHGHLISKIYFPRVMIPVAHIAVHVLDFAVGLIFLMILTLFSGYGNLWTVVLLPPFIILCLLLSIGCGLWLSAATVRYRDFRFIVPFIVQFGVFLSPVGYGSFLIPEQWIWLYSLNPMVGIIDGFRWVFFGVYPPHFVFSVCASVLMIIFILFTGFAYFRKMERTFADKI